MAVLRKPMTFGRALTYSFHMSVMSEVFREDRTQDLEVKGACSDNCTMGAPGTWKNTSLIITLPSHDGKEPSSVIFMVGSFILLPSITHNPCIVSW